MKHLTDEQLSARLDRALTGRAHEEAERHLAGCAQCRDALAALAAQDRFLGAALAHDPGEEYFATFAARVEDRLRADGIRGAQARLRDDQAPWMRWFHAPRRVAWAGAVATIVGGAAIVILTTREERMPRLRAPEVRSITAQTEPAPAAPQTAPSDVVSPQESAPSDDRVAVGGTAGSRRAGERDDAASATPGADRPQAGATPARMRPVPTSGATAPEPQMAQQSSPVAPPTEGRGVRVMKRNTAQPLQKDENLAAKETKQAADAREEAAAPPPAALQAPMAEQEKATAGAAKSGFAAPPAASGLAQGARAGEAQLCGQVLDAAGRPVAGASVALVTIGRTATTGEGGAFCMSAPGGSYELSVMAVGFQTSRLQVKVAGERSDVRVTMLAISVLDGQVQNAPVARLEGGESVKLNATTGTKTDAKKQATPSTSAPSAKAKTPPKDPFAGESKTAIAATTRAMEATRFASTYPTLPTWQKATGLWKAAADAVKTPSGRGEALYRIAQSRVNEWRQYPTPARKNDALYACMTVLSGTPTLDQRKDAIKWSDEVRRGPTGRD